MGALDASPFFDFLWGVERETHRMLADGSLSASRHPKALAKPEYTVDFAESQLEIVTQPVKGIPELMLELSRLTERAQRVVSPELLWPFSMPPHLPEDARIAVAQLDHAATLYREGLALRYGKARQMISGVHVNLSFGERLKAWLAEVAPLIEGEDSYEMRLARNLYRELPNFVLLFSTSPVKDGSNELAFSHRNGPAGYAGASFIPYLDLSSVEAYAAGIRRGMATESPLFSSLGLGGLDRRLQLNGNVFQSEREFYAPIRIRQATLAGETSLEALERRGAGYLELRCFDVDPFHYTGVAEDTLRMMHLFALDALVRPSVAPDEESLRADLREVAAAATIHPLDELKDRRFARLDRRLAELRDWVRLLDLVERRGAYNRVLRSLRTRVADPQLLPAPTLARAFRDSGRDWTQFGIETALGLTQVEREALRYAVA